MKKLALLALLLPGLGCVHLEPVGPMAKALGTKPAATSAGPGVKVTAAQDAPMGPIIQNAPPPPLPALLVTPGEVSAANHQDAASRLMREMEADRKAIDSMPRYADVSVIKK